MTELSFGAEIKEIEGRRALVMNNDAYFRTRLQKAPQGKYTVTVSSNKPNRSNQQNRYYWGVCLALISEETGNEPEHLHEYAKRRFLQPRFITVKGETIKIPATTTLLNKSDFAEYIMKLEEWSGVQFPSPEEAGYFTK